MKLTPLAKVLITVVVVGAVGAGIYMNRERIAPSAKRAESNVPPVAALPGEPGAGAGTAPADTSKPGCAHLPEVRFLHWAWNSQMGLMLATGGKQAAEGSLMCEYGVNLKLIREDEVDIMQSQLLSFAEGLRRGDKNPSSGAHFVAIMGDGGAVFLKGVNDQLARLGPDYIAVVVGSAGYSRGEDKFMGPPAWKENPQNARGGLVAGVLRDGGWNIAMKWLGDNGIPNNPNETAYDPDALNWVLASDYIDAAQKYVSGYCTTLTNIKTKKREKRCVDGAVTWTPGDVTIAREKGGLVSIASTREYRWQMPNTIIGNKKWMADNPEIVKGMLRAIFEGSDQVKDSPEARRRAAALSAVIYGEQDADYWDRYFDIQVERDKQGVMVELGGSQVNNLADNLQLYGLAPGSSNIFAATYTVFGNVVKSQYPDLFPDFYPAEQILDTSYIEALAAAGTATTKADLPTFAAEERVTQVLSRRAWNIQFATGSATFSGQSAAQLQELLQDLLIAGGTLVELHGHTDSVGGVEANMRLSEERAFAVKTWLEKQAPGSFPAGRIRVFAHGQSQPLASNASNEGRATNRRVEVVLGTAN